MAVVGLERLEVGGQAMGAEHEKADSIQAGWSSRQSPQRVAAWMPGIGVVRVRPTYACSSDRLPT